MQELEMKFYSNRSPKKGYSWETPPEPIPEDQIAETVTTEVDKYDTEYQPSPLLAHGETYLLEKGRNGYKAEAYKIRWDAQGNQISKELLCKSSYKSRNEVIQFGR